MTGVTSDTQIEHWSQMQCYGNKVYAPAWSSVRHPPVCDHYGLLLRSLAGIDEAMLVDTRCLCGS
jgi:hypothetical protein